MALHKFIKKQTPERGVLVWVGILAGSAIGWLNHKVTKPTFWGCPALGAYNLQRGLGLVRWLPWFWD